MLVIQALSRQEVDDVIAMVLADPVDGSLRQLLWELSRGGRAVPPGGGTSSAWSSGALRVEDGLWRWPDRFAPGDRLADLVGLRMGTLSPAELEVLEVVALGEPLAAFGAPGPGRPRGRDLPGDAAA